MIYLVKSEAHEYFGVLGVFDIFGDGVHGSSSEEGISDTLLNVRGENTGFSCQIITVIRWVFFWTKTISKTPVFIGKFRLSEVLRRCFSKKKKSNFYPFNKRHTLSSFLWMTVTSDWAEAQDTGEVRPGTCG